MPNLIYLFASISLCLFGLIWSMAVADNVKFRDVGVTFLLVMMAFYCLLKAVNLNPLGLIGLA